MRWPTCRWIGRCGSGSSTGWTARASRTSDEAFLPVISVSDAADVFSAIGTVGAFGVAMYLLRKEQQREAARSEDERRAQAARVSAWLETSPTSHGGRELLFHVHNASDMPIYEVSLPTMTPGEEDSEAEFIG